MMQKRSQCLHIVLSFQPARSPLLLCNWLIILFNVMALPFLHPMYIAEARRLGEKLVATLVSTLSATFLRDGHQFLFQSTLFIVSLARLYRRQVVPSSVLQQLRPNLHVVPTLSLLLYTVATK